MGHPVVPERLIRPCYGGLEGLPLAKFETIWTSKRIQSQHITYDKPIVTSKRGRREKKGGGRRRALYHLTNIKEIIH